MNAELVRLGQKPMPREARPWLSAPPCDWEEDLAARWGAVDESLRLGTCGLEFRIYKDGRGLKGAHFLIKRAPEPEGDFTTGSSRTRVSSGHATDTLFFNPSPVSGFRGKSFGYGGGSDRGRTRYAVSDESGIVRFDRLPNIPIKIEVLVPTANFPEPGRNWDLWMETPGGEYRLASNFGDHDRVRSHEPPAVVQLQEGETVRYPKLVVCPVFGLNLRDWVRPAFGVNLPDWDKVDRENFVLRWVKVRPPHAKSVRYEIRMSLVALAESPSMITHLPPVASGAQSLDGTEWPVGVKGVGGLRLMPGNLYLFEVRALDEKGAVLARSAKTPVWTAWDYRETEPPIIENDHKKLAPIYADVWKNGSINYGKVPDESFPQRIARFLREQPRSFEHDYVRLGRAWRDWHEGKEQEAAKQLRMLVEELPKGNLARGTAAWLLQEMGPGREPPKRLKFVPDTGEE